MAEQLKGLQSQISSDSKTAIEMSIKTISKQKSILLELTANVKKACNQLNSARIARRKEEKEQQEKQSSLQSQAQGVQVEESACGIFSSEKFISISKLPEVTERELEAAGQDESSSLFEGPFVIRRVSFIVQMLQDFEVKNNNDPGDLSFKEQTERFCRTFVRAKVEQARNRVAAKLVGSPLETFEAEFAKWWPQRAIMSNEDLVAARSSV